LVWGWEWSWFLGQVRQITRSTHADQSRRHGASLVGVYRFFAKKEASLKNSQGRSKLVVVFVALAMVAALGGAALAGPAPAGLKPHVLGSPSDLVQVAVQLNEAPTTVVYRQHLDLHSSKVAAAAVAVNHLSVVETEQRDFRARLAQARLGGITESFSLQRTYNGIAYVTTRDKIDALRKLPGVKSVNIIPPKALDNARSVPFIGAPDIWTSLGSPLQGQGIKLGVIDTGLDYLHTTFGGSGDPADYTANDTAVPTYDPLTHSCGAADAYFPSAKAVGGIDLAGAAYDVLATPPIYTTLPDCDPMDFHGHGTHVAGTATGYGVNADGTTYTGPWDDTTDFASLRIGPGVAPLASLYSIKIIGDNPSGSSTLISAAVEWAVDPNGDGLFDDRLDVVNISFGGSFGVDNVETEVYRNAVQLGLILCISQGNAGDYYFIGGSPGSTPEVITVAASQHDKTTAPRVVVNAPASIAGTKVAAGAAFGPALGTPGLTGDVVANIDNDADPSWTDNPLDGCDPSTLDLTGKIALINRGQCPFTLKVLYAQFAGASGVIIANNAAGPPAGMADTDYGYPVTIPAVMVSQADGNAIRTALGSGTVNVTMLDMLFTAQADNLATFSSRGPTRVLGHAVLKPDISAPGVQIISAEAGSGNLGVAFDGTSMAAPHMTGVMALLRQQHPTWTPAELKALVMNTADHDVYLNETDNPRKRIGPSRGGAGRVDLVPATAGAVIAFDKAHPERVSLSFQTLDVVGQATEGRTIQLVNKDTTNSVSYDVTIDMAVATDGASVEVPASTVTVPASGTVDLAVTLTADGATMIRQRDATVSAAGGRYWLAEHSGWIVFTPQGGGAEPTLRVPFFAALNPASDLHADGPLGATGLTGTASLTMEGQGVDTLITCDDCSNPNGPASLVSAFEMKYASPAEPPLTGSWPGDWDPANSDGADLKYVGVASDRLDAGSTAASTLYFGIVTHGIWGTPREVEFDLYIKHKGAADWQYVVYNYDQGVSSTVPGTDRMATYLIDLSDGSMIRANWLNNMPGSWLYVPTFLADAMVVPVAAADIGVGDGTAELEFAVYSWSMNSYGSDMVDATPTLSYDAAHPGFMVPGDQTWFGLPPYLYDNQGETLAVTYDLAAARANVSGGMLLIHWLNARGQRGEMVPVDGLTCATNADCPTWEKPVCEPMSGICLGCVGNTTCRGGEWCDDYGTRECVTDCTVPWANACAPGAFCNEATKLCVNDCRWQGAEPCAAGSYCSTLSGLCVVANALVKQTPELPGTHCPTGGVKIETGIDDNGNGVLDYGPPTEVDQTSYVCNGLPTLVKAVDIPPGTGPCANGGQIIYAGVDDNADHVLQESEYDSAWYACNGFDGHNSILKITDEAPGDNCAAGGKKVETGIDDNGDGVLQAGEVDHLEYVCNGVGGSDGKPALVSITDEAAGDNCPAGGKKVEAGIDANGNGVLDAAEVDQTSYICNGSDGATGSDGTPGGQSLVETTALASGADCAAGGILVKTGLDANGNGKLDADEITSVTAVCTGAKGKGCSASPSASGATPLAFLLLLGLFLARRRP
jgi:subtilisin family serine protease